MSAQLIFDIEKLEKENDTLRRQLAEAVGRKEVMSEIPTIAVCAQCGSHDGHYADCAAPIIEQLKKQLAARDEALGPFVEVAEAIMRRKSSMRPYSDESLIVSTCGKAIVWKHLRHARAVLKGKA